MNKIASILTGMFIGILIRIPFSGAETMKGLNIKQEKIITFAPPMLRSSPFRRSMGHYERLLKGDVKYRFSIDMASLK